MTNHVRGLLRATAVQRRNKILPPRQSRNLHGGAAFGIGPAEMGKISPTSECQGGHIRLKGHGRVLLDMENVQGLSSCLLRLIRGYVL